MSKERHPVNEGIQAENVNAGALAVGRGSMAVINAGTIALPQIVKEEWEHCRAALERVRLPAESEKEVEKAVASIDEEMALEQPRSEKVRGLMAQFGDKLKGAGLVITNIADLIGPLRKIASLMGETWNWLAP